MTDFPETGETLKGIRKRKETLERKMGRSSGEQSEAKIVVVVIVTLPEEM